MCRLLYLRLSRERGDRIVSANAKRGNHGSILGIDVKRLWARANLLAATALLLTTACIFLPASPAGASNSKGGAVTNFPGVYTEGITEGPDGAIWFTNGHSIGRISPSGVITLYTGSGIDSPVQITSGPDGALWFTNGLGGPNNTGSIGRITTSGVVSEYTDASIVQPWGITSGPDGALWFTNQGGGPEQSGSIGRITTAGVISDYTDSSIDIQGGITTGPDGALWFTNGNSIGRISTSGVISAYRDASIDYPFGITAGPDGALWFTNYFGFGAGSIGRITTSGVVTNYTDPSIDDPAAITTGPDGALWFTNYGYYANPQAPSTPGSIGRITTSGVVSNYDSFASPGVDAPFGIAAGSDGALSVL